MNPAWICLPPHPRYSELALYFLSLNLRDRRLVDQYHSCVTSFEMLEQLEQMNPREIQYLARLNPKLAQLTVNLTGLESGMRVIEQLKSEQQNIVWLIKNGANKALITQARVFDVYRGTGVPDGAKSVAVEILLQPREKTLTDAEIEALSAKVVAAAEKATGAKLRA